MYPPWRTRIPLSEVIDLSIKEGFSRIPVYKEDIDNIVGMVAVKDLLPLIYDKQKRDEAISDPCAPSSMCPSRCIAGTC